MLKAYYKIFKYNKDEKLIKKGRKYLSRSFLKQFVNSLYTATSGLTCSSTDISNTSRTITINSTTVGNNMFYCNGLAGSGVQFYQSGIDSLTINKYEVGIIVGTGNTAVTPSDYKLETPIVHGTTSGTMEYLGHFFASTVTVSAPNATFTIERMYKNSSGGSITVKEIGIYSVNPISSNCYSFCICRDILSSSVSVSDGEYLKITYTIQITA